MTRTIYQWDDYTITLSGKHHCASCQARNEWLYVVQKFVPQGFIKRDICATCVYSITGAIVPGGEHGDDEEDATVH